MILLLIAIFSHTVYTFPSGSLEQMFQWSSNKYDLLCFIW